MIVGVYLQPKSKVIYCDTGEIQVELNDYVVLDIEHGADLGKVVIAEAQQASNPQKPLVKLVRQAQPEDLEKAKQNYHKESEALNSCKKLVSELDLAMKPLVAHYNLDGKHLTIYFSAQTRIDFRELVRKLSQRLKTRVELRQVSPRDEARLIGGIGKCGRPLCCQSFLKEFVPVSIRMAKEQELSLSPMKISGICGRLLCCLSYECKQYAAMREKMPRVKQEISTPFGKAKVISTNPLKETVTIKLDDQSVRELSLDELT